jgi:hypothetical protein
MSCGDDDASMWEHDLVVDVRNVIHHRETLNNIGTCPPGSEYMCFLWQRFRDAVPVRSVGGIEILYCSCVLPPMALRTMDNLRAARLHAGYFRQSWRERRSKVLVPIRGVLAGSLIWSLRTSIMIVKQPPEQQVTCSSSSALRGNLGCSKQQWYA